MYFEEDIFFVDISVFSFGLHLFCPVPTLRRTVQDTYIRARSRNAGSGWSSHLGKRVLH